MRICRTNIWSHLGTAAVIFVTTNTDVKKDGEAVMGAGIAKQALQRWPNIGKILGNLSRAKIETPSCLITESGTEIWSFPTKRAQLHNPEMILPAYRSKFPGPIVPGWACYSDKVLIEVNMEWLRSNFADRPAISQFLLPWPGVGNGGLTKEAIFPIVSKLDDRFILVER